MRRYLSLFWHLLRFHLRKKRTWIPILLLPIMLLTIVLIPKQEASAAVTVGIVSADDAGAEFARRLVLRSDETVSFVQTDQEDMLLHVSAGMWDCGLVLDDSFGKRLQQADFHGLITVCTSDNSVVYPLVKETTASVMAAMTAPVIAREYLLHADICKQEDLPQYETTLAQILPEEDRVSLQVQTQNGQDISIPNAARDLGQNLLRTAVALLLQIWILFAAVDAGKWTQTSFFRRLAAGSGKGVCLFLSLSAAALPMLLGAAMGLAFVQDPALPALLPFGILLIAGAVLLSLLKRVWNALPLLMPFFPVLSLVFSPVIFDLAVYFPVLAPVSRFMPLTLVLQTAQGSSHAMIMLWLEAALLSILAALAAKQKTA